MFLSYGSETFLTLARATDMSRHQFGEDSVRVRTPVAIELPRLAPLGDEIEIAVRDEDFLVRSRLGEQLAGRVEHDAAAVIDVVSFLPDAIEPGHEILV